LAKELIASEISGAHGKSGSAAVNGITPSDKVAHLKLKARFFKISKLTESFLNI
jgi:hypothetical protein